MIFFTAFILGMNLGAAGLFAKHLNSMAGFGIANKSLHNYFTLLGKLSNSIIPIVALVATIAAKGFMFGTGVFLSTLLGAFVLGLLNPSYNLKMLISLIGVPVSLIAFFLSLV